ncbi:hypothetical protein EW026_g7943 [Hermanssonia centrifuga]|uniref:Gag protein n=1 Tax=Hermanssonia centrifuga TaxID=98765 RepID=A0A4S4K7X1_9APHY|nr:hypothetical protein EW026_g7943 [Hermanssonia centrifuga]
MPVAGTSASLVHPSPKNVPLLTPGSISPIVLIDWINACSYYFDERDIKDDKKVQKIAGGLQDPLVRDWFTNNAIRLKSLDWDTFITEFKTEWLENNWAETIRNELLRSCQKDIETFRDWTVSIEKLNAVLRGTADHLSDRALHTQLEIAAYEDLANTLRKHRTDLTKLATYREWKKAVIILDNKRVSNLKRVLRALATQRSTPATVNRPTFNRTSSSNLYVCLHFQTPHGPVFMYYHLATASICYALFKGRKHCF